MKDEEEKDESGAGAISSFSLNKETPAHPEPVPSCLSSSSFILPPSSLSLIVNADDFGASSAVNRAIIQAHDEGILTSTSLMVGGDAFEEAVELAKSRPNLAVGLHLTFVFGKSVLSRSEIPHLVDEGRNFPNDPALAGVKYFFSPAARREIRREVRAQFERFAATGLPFSHVDGHLHIHLHPVIFRELVRCAEEFGVRRVRLPREKLGRNLQIRWSNLTFKLLHWGVFGCLSRSAARTLRRRNFLFADEVHGLLETGRMTEDYWLELLPRLTAASNEIYCHPEIPSPTLPEHNRRGDAELAALLSRRVRDCVERLNYRLTNYADLS